MWFSFLHDDLNDAENNQRFPFQIPPNLGKKATSCNIHQLSTAVTPPGPKFFETFPQGSQV
jgi:hypothetical protein